MASLNNNIEFNDLFLQALSIMEDTTRSVFITGKAGTGKSTLLRYYRENTRKNIAVIAPTGVAAVNIKGQTIHSFFWFKPDITPDKVKKISPRNKSIYKKLDAIVIDEISMVRADLLDCVDAFLRIHGKKKNLPFGGIQMIFVGDLYQLPPVVTSKEKDLFADYYRSPYFFDAKVFGNGKPTLLDEAATPFDMEFIELEKVYRQRDDDFLNLLNAIRNNTADEGHLSKLNERYISGSVEDKEDFYVYLATTNQLVDGLNAVKIAELKGKEYSYKGVCKGDFAVKDVPTAMEIIVKVGAQVMLLNNDSEGRWINGSIGRVAEIESGGSDPDIIWVDLPEGTRVDVTPHTWELFEFFYDKKSSKVLSQVTGIFMQYPLKLAWAITIHKSQGMTFDKVILDIGGGTFSHGQLYVALSRCTTLNGIVLKKPLMKRHILMDRKVMEFATKYQYKRADIKNPRNERIATIELAIKKKARLEIVYLKTKDEKSRRIVSPSFLGELEYQGKRFLGLKAYCSLRGAERVFHIERILEIKMLN